MYKKLTPNDNVILSILSLNPQGLTPAEISNKTSLIPSTVVKHLREYLEKFTDHIEGNRWVINKTGEEYLETGINPFEKKFENFKKRQEGERKSEGRKYEDRKPESRKFSRREERYNFSRAEADDSPRRPEPLPVGKALKKSEVSASKKEE